MTATDQLTPSERARELVRGAYDMHVHIAPDSVERRIDDVALARRFAGAGARRLPAEVALHLDGGARRASSRGVVPGRRGLGAVALNRAVGGHEPAGGRDRRARGRAHRVAADGRLAQRDDRRPRARARRQAAGVDAPAAASCATQGVDIEPVPVVDDDGALLPETHDVLAAVARHGMVLATGHLGRDEIFAVVDAARRGGRRRRSSSPTPSSRPRTSASRTRRELADQRRAARALLHHAAHRQGRRGSASSTRSAPPGPSARCSRPISARSFNPPVEDGLALMADRFLEAGFDEEEVHAMAVTNTRRLAGATA